MMPKLARRTKFGKAQMERSTEQDKLQWRQATVREHELILVTHILVTHMAWHASLITLCCHALNKKKISEPVAKETGKEGPRGAPKN